MGNEIYRGLLEVDDERLVVLEEEVRLLAMLRLGDDGPIWRISGEGWIALLTT